MRDHDMYKQVEASNIPFQTPLQSKLSLLSFLILGDMNNILNKYNNILNK